MENIFYNITRYVARVFFRPHVLSDSAYQEKLLFSFLAKNTKTRYWKNYNFTSIKTITDFQKKIPLQTYDNIQIHVEHMLQGWEDILRQWKIPYFSKSSGTTAVSKYIPISHKALKKNHYAVARDGFWYYLAARTDSNLFVGKWLLMWWRLAPNPFDPDMQNVWDVSAILQYNAPWYTKIFRKPSESVSFMEHFDKKLDAMIEETKDLNITFIAWVPSWLTVFLQRLVEKTGKNNVLEVRPNIELFMWWWINLAPYKKQLAKLLPWDQVWYWQNYNASEWFIAFQDKPYVEDMLLATHHHIFYEFIAQEHIDDIDPPIVLLQDLQIGKSYEIIITTDWWLRRYRIGDVVQITSIDPVRVRVVWRTKSYLNTFGEELMSHTTDAAIQTICELHHVPVANYVATTVVAEHGWYHERYIDFGVETALDKEVIINQLEQYLQAHNSDYKAKRVNDILMKPLRLHILTPGSFHSYLESKWKLGGQNKIKRLWNDKQQLITEMGEFIQ